MLKITKPTLLLDPKTCKSNIQKMTQKARRSNVRLVPHFKTHQSHEVGEWFREAGVTAITVTSVKMAVYFAGHGWNDITIAFPVNVLQARQINDLAKKVDLKIFVNSRTAAKMLQEQLDTKVRFYIEVDVGDQRSGLQHNDFSGIRKILDSAKAGNLIFEGFYTHAGHTYGAGSAGEVEKIYNSGLEKLRTLKGYFEEEFQDLHLALGDTPSCSIVEDLSGLDSIHPGNFVYYDLVQNSLGANKVEEIAICLAVPVVSVHPERHEVVVHSGWAHQGKDSITDSAGNILYGLVVTLNEGKWSAPIPGAWVTKLSQEHGVLRLPDEVLEKTQVGDVLGILPVHACATAVMMGEVYTLDGHRLEMMPK